MFDRKSVVATRWETNVDLLRTLTLFGKTLQCICTMFLYASAVAEVVAEAAIDGRTWSVVKGMFGRQNVVCGNAVLYVSIVCCVIFYSYWLIIGG